MKREDTLNRIEILFASPYYQMNPHKILICFHEIIIVTSQVNAICVRLHPCKCTLSLELQENKFHNLKIKFIHATH